MVLRFSGSAVHAAVESPNRRTGPCTRFIQILYNIAKVISETAPGLILNF